MKRWMNYGANLTLLVLYAVSQLGMLVSCTGCTVRPLFYLWVGFLCVTTFVTTATKRGWLVGLPASVLLLCLAFYFFPDDLTAQLHDALDRITGVYLEQVVYPGNTYRYLALAGEHSLLFLLLAFLLASYMGSALTSRSGRVGLSLLGSLPLFIGCLTVTLHPPVPAVFGMLLFWLLVAVGGGHFAEENDAYRAPLALLLPFALLLAALIWRVDPASYRYEPQFDLAVHLDSLVQELDAHWSDSVEQARMNRMEPDPTGADTREQTAASVRQDTLDLTQPFDPETLSRVFLRVRAAESGLLYLRGISYGDYLGSAWAQSPQGAVPSSLGFAALSLARTGMRPESLRVEDLTGGAYRCLPYFSPENGEADSYVPAVGESYTAEYYPFPDSFAGLSVPETAIESEFAYRAWAHEVYTRLPASTRAALDALCREAGLFESADPVRDVAAYVQQSGRYTLDAVPTQGDCAVAFLTQTHEGWCLHFATAAVALYRTLNIPARLVEGFLVEAEAGRSVEVTGQNAHAWVEIYRDGLGWLPVEVTGRSGLDAPALGAAETTPEPTPEPTAQPVGMEDIPSPVPAQPTQAEQPSLPVGLLTQETLEEAETARRQGMSRFALPLWALGLVLFALLFLLRRALLLRLRQRRFTQSDPGRAVVFFYRSALRASAFGPQVPELLTATAEKAVFSRQGVGERERARCLAVYERYIRETGASLKPFARFRFRWISVFY